jgi:Predicted RNA-binding protein.
MCEASVSRMDSDGSEKFLMDAADRIIPREERICLENSYGERKTVRARIQGMHLVGHKVIPE